MKKIYNLIFTIVLISIILIVYLNIDKIVDFTVKLFGDNKEITLEDANKYIRSFSNIHL